MTTESLVRTDAPRLQETAYTELNLAGRLQYVRSTVDAFHPPTLDQLQQGSLDLEQILPRTADGQVDEQTIARTSRRTGEDSISSLRRLLNPETWKLSDEEHAAALLVHHSGSINNLRTFQKSPDKQQRAAAKGAMQDYKNFKSAYAKTYARKPDDTEMFPVYLDRVTRRIELSRAIYAAETAQQVETADKVEQLPVSVQSSEPEAIAEHINVPVSAAEEAADAVKVNKRGRPVRDDGSVMSRREIEDLAAAGATFANGYVPYAALGRRQTADAAAADQRSQPAEQPVSAVADTNNADKQASGIDTLQGWLRDARSSNESRLKNVPAHLKRRIGAVATQAVGISGVVAAGVTKATVKTRTGFDTMRANIESGYTEDRILSAVDQAREKFGDARTVVGNAHEKFDDFSRSAFQAGLDSANRIGTYLGNETNGEQHRRTLIRTVGATAVSLAAVGVGLYLGSKGHTPMSVSAHTLETIKDITPSSAGGGYADLVPHGAGTLPNHASTVIDTVTQAREQAAPHLELASTGRIGQYISMPEHAPQVQTIQHVTEHLSGSGDTVSQHAFDRLQDKGVVRPSWEQIRAETQRILDLNNMTWEDARHMTKNTKFKV